MSFLCHPILACLRSIVNLLPGCSCIKGKGKKHLRTDDEETIVTQDKVVHPSSPVKTPVQSGTDSADSKTAEEKDDADAIQQSPSSEVRQPSSHLTQSSTPSSLGNQGSSAPGNDNNLDEARLDKVMRCEAMAQSLCVKFEQTGHLPDIDNAISALSNLAYLYEVRFDRSGFLEDINQSIAIRDQLLAEVASDVSQRQGRLIGLAVLLCSRFQHSGELVDIDKAISLEREAISLVPEDDASYFRYMSHLGMALSIRFERKGQRVDLDESISVQERTISLAPDDYPGKPNYYNNFGGTLLRRFEYLGDLADIGRAISMGQRAVSLVPDGHPVKPEYLSNLSTSYAARFERLGDLPDLEQSIMAAANAISLAPYPTAGLYSTLGGAYSSRFRRLGEPNDLDKAIECNRVSMSLVPEGHAAKPIYLNNLSISLRNRFLHLGQLSDIDAAILQEQQAVGLTPPDHSDYPQYVGNLATMLSLRFLQLGESKDIDEAIALAKRAVNATPKEHPALPDRLTILANCFTRRYERFGATAGIDDAILAYREAVDLTADDDRMKPGRLNNLGGPLLRRFEHFGSPQEADLELAISVLQKATSLTQEGHAETPLILSNLGMALRDRYQHRGRIEDIRESITKLEQAVSLTPDALSAKSRYLNNLGDSFAALFERSDNRTGSADKAIEAFKTSAKSIGGSPSLRLYAAREWAKIYLKRDGVPSLEAHTIVMSLVPRIVWLGSGISQRYDDVIAISDAVNEAAAAAIQLQDYTSALEWLEQGRAIVWGQMIHLRTPVDDLRAEDPALAKELQDVSRQLERAGYPQNSGSTAEAADRLSIQQEVDLHHKLAARWESLIETVRSLPGFENFLRPRTIAELSLATHGGAIVVVNMHKSRCDALILRRTPDVQLQHVALPRMSYQRGLNLRSLMLQMLSSSNVRQADSKLTRSQASDELLLSPEFWSNVVEPALEDQLEPERGGRIASVGNMSLFERILKVLWLDLVKPVVDALGYERKPDSTLSEDLPHVTWCGTGPMAFLPLHAAGVYDDSDQAQQVFEYVVSSYTPSITPLLVTRFPTNQPPPKGILAISQSATLNKPALPGAAKELDAIKEYFNGSDISCLQDKSATVTNVIKAMDERPWIHLACHGVQRADDPTKSGFCLKDGMLELSAIMEKSLQHAELAFLSACQTATGDEKRPDEGIHLAAGMLLAGYRSVLGTMWSIKDRDAPFVADEVYKYLLRNEAGEPNSRRAAYALHQAVAHFRTTLQKNDFVRWVPFIHIGSAYSLQYNVPIATRTTHFSP